MSEVVVNLAVQGAQTWAKLAKDATGKLQSAAGTATPLAFPGTAYHFPLFTALTDLEVRTVGDLTGALARIDSLLPPAKGFEVSIGTAAAAGLATGLSLEMLAGAAYYGKKLPKEGIAGFLSDSLLRSLGVQLVDGRMPGVAVILGAAPDAKTAVDIVRGFQERNILSLLVGTGPNSVFEQLKAEKVEMGLETYIVPLGDEAMHVVFALDFAVRAALSFGGIKPNNRQAALDYCRDRVFAFALALGPLSPEAVAIGAGAIAMGFPVITDQAVPEIKSSPTCLHEALVSQPDHAKLVQSCIDTRGIKIKLVKVPIPVLYGTAFEGERVRKEDMVAEFGGKRGKAFEWVTMKPFGQVEDGKITVTGPTLDQLPAGYGGNLAIIVTVAGRKMQKDFESILERQIHHLLNQAQGVMHIGQRSIVWLRISQAAKAAGFTLEHLGTIIHTKLHNDYPAIVDQVAVEIVTDNAKALARLPEADASYKERDARVAGMTDESVDTFYSCTLCQSFAPNHVCIITPERLGLCGAYNWLDGKAAYEINPTGGNQPVAKGKCLEPVKGQWQGINEFVESHSNRSIKCFSAYSIIDNPMTSCGCFEAIATVLPGTGGVMVVHREFQGMTPSGMTFSTLAGVVGGGSQQPGFIGIGINYIISKKFISAEGGLKRLVWMPKDLKDRLRPELEKRAQELGVPGLVDQIVDDSQTDDLMKTVELLVENGHPAPGLGELV